MLRALCLVLAAMLLPPATAWAEDACLLCGAPSGDAAGQGQTSAGSDARAPIEIEMTSGFNFRRFAHQGATGEVIVDAARSSFPDTGGAGYGLVGQVVIRGTPNAAVHVDLPRSIALTSKGGSRIDIARIEHTLPKSPRLDANGRLEFSFSGPLTLPAGAAPGDYQASFSIDADYE